MALDILIVDDEKDICNLVADILEDEGYNCRQAHSGKGAMEEIKKRLPNLILQDIWLGESSFDGLKILELVKEDHPELPVVMMSGHGTIETAVTAIKNGAYDFLEKPFNSERLIILVARALENARLRQENAALKQQSSIDEVPLIGTSTAAQAIQDLMKKVAPTNSRIVLQGPQGSGKETIARAIHQHSLRSDGPFVVLNCSGLSGDNLDEKLFGVEKETGFTAGVLEQAHTGTLYLDAVDEMSFKTQGLMVKALHSNEFHRVGGASPVKVDVRVLSSSTLDLKQLVEYEAFREDLYYRLNVVILEVAPLKDRKSDIPELVDYFFAQIARLQDVPTRTVSPEALIALKQYHWPGNIRQLRNVMEWVWIMMQDTSKTDVQLNDLPAEVVNEAPETVKEGGNILRLVAMPLREARETFERDYLLAQVGRFAGNVSKTAEFIGMERSALHRKLKGLEIKKQSS